jgi:hypothetical protein
MTNLKVTELTVWKDQLFGLSEDGHLVAWNEDMGSWILRGACEIKNLACENEHMIKVDRMVVAPMSRHDYGPGEIKLVIPRKGFLEKPWFVILPVVLLIWASLVITYLVFAS